MKNDLFMYHKFKDAPIKVEYEFSHKNSLYAKLIHGASFVARVEINAGDLSNAIKKHFFDFSVKREEIIQ